MQLGGNPVCEHWGDDGEWVLQVVETYSSDNQGDSRSENMTGTRAVARDHGFMPLEADISWYQHGNQKGLVG